MVSSPGVSPCSGAAPLMRILVTGSSGLIGSEAVAHFYHLGDEIFGIDNNMCRMFFGSDGDTTWCGDVLLPPMSDNLMNQARGPIKLGDYLAAGRAVLANPVGDLVEVFRAHSVGMLAGDSLEEYGIAMAALLDDPARSEQLARNRRKAAETVLAWEFLAPKLEAVYDCGLAGF